jgi:hypothetical protein
VKVTFFGAGLRVADQAVDPQVGDPDFDVFSPATASAPMSTR